MAQPLSWLMKRNFGVYMEPTTNPQNQMVILMVLIMVIKGASIWWFLGPFWNGPRNKILVLHKLHFGESRCYLFLSDSNSAWGDEDGRSHCYGYNWGSYDDIFLWFRGTSTLFMFGLCLFISLGKWNWR